MFIRNKKVQRVVAIVLAVQTLVQAVAPVPALALTSGPHSPEFSSFEPVATTDMVNLFSGDFNYNLPVLEIPGPDGAGYAISLSYHSGNSLEEESSWVGFGWTLNPGAINRNARGFPDDYQNTSITQYNQTRPNWSATVTNSAGLEVMSKDEARNRSFAGISARRSLRFNNYQGYARTNGYGLSVMGTANLNLTTSAQGPTFSADINFMGLYNHLKKKSEKQLSGNDKFTTKGFGKNLLRNSLRSALGKAVNGFGGGYGSTYGMYSFAGVERATGMTKLDENLSRSRNYSMGVMVPFTPGPVSIGFQTGFYGNYNTRVNQAFNEYKANGYMYNPGGPAANQLADYSVERSSPFNKRDLYLGIPFNNADVFMVNGEGLSGGFRFHPHRAGHFYPDLVTNKTDITQGGFDLTLGPSKVGVGFNFGMGSQKAKMGNWKRTGNTSSYSFNPDKSGVFRFMQDMGGSVSYAGSGLSTADVDANSFVPGFKNAEPKMPGDIATEEIDFDNSSFVYYHTRGEAAPLANRFNRSANQTEFENGLKLLGQDGNKRVVEMSVRNTEGMQYVYGLPVFARNETNLHFDVRGGKIVDRYLAYQHAADDARENHLVRQADGTYGVALQKFNPHTSAVGEIRPAPYASAYLLTQIFNSDYVEVADEDPKHPNLENDFGGWTQFHYRQKQYDDGLQSDAGKRWYSWRAPYTGLLYQPNEISDHKDDMGSVTAGEKENYYLKAIETKSHVAYFVTNASQPSYFTGADLGRAAAPASSLAYLKGSLQIRKDGLGAARIPDNGADPAAADDAAKNRNQPLEYLEKIVLFAKGRPDKPLKTIHFSYDYSLVQNLPNSLNGNYPAAKTSSESGKLTLKRVWFEYEGAVNSRISPYEFSYAYKKRSQLPDYVANTYPHVLRSSDHYSAAAENPDYAPHLLDPWGNVQQYGQERRKYLIPWVYQGVPLTTDARGTAGKNWKSEVPLPAAQPGSGTMETFDPAAWQLKGIKLPSGAEILLEYEQKDYAYVQDRSPMTMTSLLKAQEGDLTNNGKQYNLNPKYVINVRDLGIEPPKATDTQTPELDAQINLLKEYFGNDNRLYFRFLYGMTNKPADLDDCASEYITGYVTVDAVNGINPVEVNGEKHIEITVAALTPGESREAGTSYEAVPRQACYDYYTTQRFGKVEEGCENDLETGFDETVYEPARNPVKHAQDIAKLMGKMQDRLSNTKDYGIPSKGEVGNNLNLPLSFLKLPMLKAKKGGGVRVKRLLIMDPGIERGDAAIYGQEYLYQDFRKVKSAGKTVALVPISSGIATNEPAEAREENPLVGFLPRKSQTWLSRVTAGVDREQTEGPLGESLLPGASVGHSRVVVRNIYNQQTAATDAFQSGMGTGFSVHQFYTVKDYPFDYVYTGDDQKNYDFGVSAPGVDHTHLPDNRVLDPLIIPAGLFYYRHNKLYAGQGYRFLINSMHGQLREVADFAGEYTLTATNAPVLRYDPSLVKAFHQVSGQTYTYYNPGEKVKMLRPNGTYTLELPGKEMDLSMEMKSVSDQTTDLSLEVDISFDFLTFTIAPSAGFAFELSDEALSTHVISKVIRYPAIVKSVSSFQDGVVAVTENLAFNPHTGQPVLTRTRDGFHGVSIADSSIPPVTDATLPKHDGSVYNLTLPASWYYPEMGPASQTYAMVRSAATPTPPELRTNQLSAAAGQIVSYGAAGNPLRSLAGTTNGDTWANKPPAAVIQAQAQTFRRNWFTQPADPAGKVTTSQLIENHFGIPGAARARLNLVMRPELSYVYRDDAISANTTDDLFRKYRVYNSGTIASGTYLNTRFDLFAGWWPQIMSGGAVPPDQSKWTLTNTVEHYSPHGNPLQERSLLNVYSAATYGYQGMLPTMVAGNARYGTVAFQDFEHLNASVNNPAAAHSGNRYFELKGAQSLLPQLTVSSELLRTGGILKMWVRAAAAPGLSLALTSGAITQPLATPVRIAQTGDWSLYEVAVPAAVFASLSADTPFNLTFNNAAPEALGIDDVRFQPTDSQATCYVYDTGTLRLTAQFDDQHFGLYYQYNDEGKLVRKLIETEKGLKTVQETQYNTPKIPRF